MTGVSRETLLQLKRFGDLVGRWSRRINLVSRANLDDMWERHILDSLQLEYLATKGTRWADLGSGAGFPGLVVSICRPESDLILVEADQRKATFLRHVITELGLNAKVVADRIESCEPLQADIVSARALATLPELVPCAVRHGHPSTIYVFPKGRRHREEIAATRQEWSFDVDVRPSKTENGAVILLMEHISRV